MRPFLIIFILLLIGFEILILFPKQTEKPTEASQASAPADNKDGTPAKKTSQQKMQGTQIHLVESQKGSRDWELFSQSAQSDPTSSIWDLSDMKVLFYNDEKQSIVLTGQKGKIDTQTKDMKIEGNVNIETTNGYLFVAPYVEYHAKDRLITCNSLVEVKGPMLQGRRSLFLKGTGMRIPVSAEKMYLDHDVSGEKLFPGDKTITLKSEKAELSSLNQTAQFFDHVVVHYPPMTMNSEKAIFSYNEKTKLFEYLDMIGKVELRDENRRAISDKLRVDFATKQFTFSGQPRLYQGEDELAGEQIVFIDAGKKVRVEKVKLKSVEGIQQ
jgi:LPS export ABC transporter protein LptC/lipopolysaccharide transport protein LptA